MEPVVQKFDTKVISAKVILLDIEGTTTSKSFVKDTLFPYVVENVSTFLTSNWDDEEVVAVVAALRELAQNDKKENVEGCVEIKALEDSRDSVIQSVVDNVKWQVGLDRKTGPLKTLQGLIWAKGYKDGTIKGHVYDDVSETLPKWVASGHRIYVYSSGSVAAQKQLFGHSEKGDLLENFVGFFDTSVGSKQDVESYRNITKEIACDADRILFLTDIVKEAEAAVEAGMLAVLLERDSDTTFTEEDRQKYGVITSFADLPLAGAGKRKSLDKTEEELPPAKVAKTDIADAADSTDALKEIVPATSNDCTMAKVTVEDKTEDTNEVSVPKSDETEDKTETKLDEKLKEVDEVEPMEVDSAITKEETVSSTEAVQEDSPSTEDTAVTAEVSTNEVKETKDKTDSVEEVKKEIEEKMETVTSETQEDVITESVSAVESESAEPIVEADSTKTEAKDSVSEKVVTEVTEVTETAQAAVEEAESSKVVPKESENTTEVVEASESTNAEAMETDSGKLPSAETVAQSQPEETDSTKVETELNLNKDSEKEKSLESDETKISTEVTESSVKIEEKKVDSETEEVLETKAAEKTETSNTEDKPVPDSSSDVKEVTEAVATKDHPLKESNGIESTNGTNGSTTAEEEVVEPKSPAKTVETNGDAVESSTNGGTDSDKENDKEEDKKSEVVTNGSSNGVTDEVVHDVKVKKITPDSPVTAQVEEA